MPRSQTADWRQKNIFPHMTDNANLGGLLQIDGAIVVTVLCVSRDFDVETRDQDNKNENSRDPTDRGYSIIHASSGG
jgi:hypothetical protein